MYLNYQMSQVRVYVSIQTMVYIFKVRCFIELGTDKIFSVDENSLDRGTFPKQLYLHFVQLTCHHWNLYRKLGRDEHLLDLPRRYVLCETPWNNPYIA
jgi:hypothetical protein